MKNTTNDNSLMQVLFGSFGTETTVYHGPPLLFFFLFSFFLQLFTHSMFQLPQSQIRLFFSSSSVPARADAASVFFGLLTELYGFSFKLAKEVVHCLVLLLTDVLQWV